MLGLSEDLRVFVTESSCMRKFMISLLGSLVLVTTPAVIPTGAASAQAKGEQEQKDAIVKRVEMAHQTSLTDKAYMQALEKNDQRVIKDTLVRNGAPPNINVVDPKAGQGGSGDKRKGWVVHVVITLSKPVTIDVSISKA
jgi:hypothetical protein